MTIKTLKIINKILFILILSLAVYIIVAPFLPQIFMSSKNNEMASEYYKVDNLDSENINSSKLLPASYRDSTIEDNIEAESKVIDESLSQIQINSINLDSKLISSQNNKDLWKGIWHRSNTGNPVDGGNMVITAHRFLYTGNNNTFYNLPKVKNNEIISIYWKGIKYDYKVNKVFEVTPDAIEIEAPTQNHILTLYTCTPLWTSTRRFVIQAEPLF
jgi:LPXTG-site transpeptidase (sortase) family protein